VKVKTSVWLQRAVTKLDVLCVMSHSFAFVIFFVVECGIVRFLSAMHVFELKVRPSLSKLSFLSWPPQLS